MIDTIRLLKRGTNGKDFEINLDKFNYQVINQKEVTWFNTFYESEKLKSKPINVKYNETKNYLTLTCSVPKILYGNSLTNYKAIDAASFLVELEARLRGILSIELWKMEPSRLDISKNLLMENCVSDYIQALEYGLKVSKRNQVQRFDISSIIIGNKSKRIIFYDKEKEQEKLKELPSDYRKTGKILRMEVQLKNQGMIKKELKLGNEIDLFEDILRNRNYESYLQSVFNRITRDYNSSNGNSQLIDLTNDLILIELIASEYKRSVLEKFYLKKYVGDYYDRQISKQLLNHLGFSERGISKAVNELERLLDLGLVNGRKEMNLLKEIAVKLVA